MITTKDQLNKLTIRNLREFGRIIGVVSPTTMAKENLVREILNVIDGNSKCNTNIGAQLEEVKDSFLPDDFEYLKSLEVRILKNAKFIDFLLSNRTLRMNRPSEVFEGFSDRIERIYEGYAFCPDGDNWYLFDDEYKIIFSLRDAEIDESMLRPGCELTVRVYKKRTKVIAIDGMRIVDYSFPLAFQPLPSQQETAPLFQNSELKYRVGQILFLPLDLNFDVYESYLLGNNVVAYFLCIEKPTKIESVPYAVWKGEITKEMVLFYVARCMRTAERGMHSSLIFDKETYEFAKSIVKLDKLVGIGALQGSFTVIVIKNNETTELCG